MAVHLLLAVSRVLLGAAHVILWTVGKVGDMIDRRLERANIVDIDNDELRAHVERWRQEAGL